MRFYRGLKPVHAMTFDLDDTLYDNWPVIENLELKAQGWLHQYHPVSQQLTQQQWHSIKNQLAQDTPFLKSDVTQWRIKQIEQGLMLLGYSQDQAQQAAQDLMEQVLVWRHQIDIPSQTHLVLSQLQQHMPLVAITNGNVNPDKIGLGQYFDLVLNAGPDGWAKPHSQMFETALTHLGLSGENVLHVGDHLNSDVFGAKAAGMQACWLNEGDGLDVASKIQLLPDLEINDLVELLHFIKINQ